MADDTWPTLAKILAKYDAPTSLYRSPVVDALATPQAVDRSAANLYPSRELQSGSLQAPLEFGQPLAERLPSGAMEILASLLGPKLPFRVVKSAGTGIHGESFYDAMHDNGGLIARLKVHPDNSVGNIWVEPTHQRHGIATALYDYAAKDLGVPRLGPGSYQTPEGQALRRAYDERLIPDPVRNALALALQYRDSAMSYIPPEAMLAANVVVPGMKSAPRVSTQPGRRWTNSGWAEDPKTYRLSVESDAGHVGGVVDPASRTIQAGGSYVNENARGQGHGTALYEALAEKARELGYQLVSDGPVSASAARVYDALARRGYDVRRHPDAQVDSFGNVSVKGGDPSQNAYTIVPRSEND